MLINILYAVLSVLLMSTCVLVMIEIHHLRKAAHESASANAKMARLLSGYHSIADLIWDAYTEAERTNDEQHHTLHITVTPDGGISIKTDENE